MIPFTKPTVTGQEQAYITQAINGSHLSGDGPFTKKCHQWFEEKLGCQKALLTPSCTAALEMAAILIDIQPGDEVIMPSYTFVSTANAFVLRGATIVFVDIHPDTMNIDETLIEAAITSKTKAIVPVHYAGVACQMDTIMDIAERHGLFVIEDAAQAMMSTFEGRPLGTIGHIGTYSFHATKNYTSGGEGGLLIINDEQFSVRAEFIRDKGTNRKQFFRGSVDKYTWVDIGSSFLPSELQGAYLYSQLELAEDINIRRRDLWNKYYSLIKSSPLSTFVGLPEVPKYCVHNAHMFQIKLSSETERSKLIKYLKNFEIESAFHYIPLHSSNFGKQKTKFVGADIYTTSESEKLLRLPMYDSLTHSEVSSVVKAIEGFFNV
ncbi:dTDP-4-amino-4,6-dideoxygalactose transaminase [Vibrio diazotrophicus]|uniref:dTDP-4-amino-4,6-dideoxygalactose transaminase n=1 Tax=Vibrio diazotrophicus TaxID=685 RepID=UPI0005A6AF11|nr:dTDP-4-amino-4,6-dideoxygalactose transaminase [Vibrio diazotrophicus]